MKKRAFTLIELLVVISIIAIIAALLFGFIGGCSRSEGSRVGQVTKFSYKNNWGPKSWEGDLQVGSGYETWKFSVVPSNLPVVASVKRALRSGQRVELTYDQVRMTFGRTDTPYHVRDVTFLDDKGNVVP